MMLASFSFTQFVLHGGFFMYLLLICSVISLATILLRAWALRRDEVLPPQIESEIDALPAGDQKRSLARLTVLVHQNPAPLAKIVATCLKYQDLPRAENMEAIQTRARQEVGELESGLGVLEVVVGVAPLLGLLGAVAGLVTVFGELGSSESISDPRTLAMGIAEALNTTIAGLAIAIPSLIAHSYFSKRVEKLSLQMEALVGELIIKRYSQPQEPHAANAAGWVYTPVGHDYADEEQAEESVEEAAEELTEESVEESAERSPTTH